MVCGVGIGTAMALNGVAAHAYAHIIYKALLFMGAGAVLEMTGRSKLSELGGLYRTMPLTMIFTIIGGIAISGFPLTSGFVSKSMIVAAAGYNHQTVLLVMLLLAGVGTFLSVGIKLPILSGSAKIPASVPRKRPGICNWPWPWPLCLYPVRRVPGGSLQHAPLCSRVPALLRLPSIRNLPALRLYRLRVLSDGEIPQAPRCIQPRSRLVLSQRLGAFCQFRQGN